MTDAAAIATIETLGVTGFVSSKDVLTLRREVFADGVVSAAELDALFRLGERAPNGDREWNDYFAEVSTDFYLRQNAPEGYLTDDEYKTLRARVTRDGRIASALELQLLLTLSERAISTPNAMAGFIGAQLKKRIETKVGGPRIEAEDASLVRRFIFAAGGHGNVAVTRPEAEFLFDMNDLVAAADNDPDWALLFKQAIANHLMAHIGKRTLSVGEAIALETADRSDGNPGEVKTGFGDFLGNVFTPFRAHAKRVEKRYAKRNAERAVAAAQAEKITETEADWLAERIGRDGEVHASEKALLQHMRSLEADLPPKLQALVSDAA
ncbi:MAG: hypothetical protein AAF850_00625 [Pseudomonadota bacterium]